MLTLNWLADFFKPALGPAGKSMHHLGFRRGYYVGAVTGVVVTFLFLQLAGCTGPSDAGSCYIPVYVDENGLSCRTNDLEADTLACCPDGYTGVGYDAEGAVICLEEN
jgi:hypothetical protein